MNNYYNDILTFINKWNTSTIDDELIKEYKQILPIVFQVMDKYDDKIIYEWWNEYSNFILYIVD